MKINISLDLVHADFDVCDHLQPPQSIIFRMRLLQSTLNTAQKREFIALVKQALSVEPGDVQAGEFSVQGILRVAMPAAQVGDLLVLLKQLCISAGNNQIEIERQELYALFDLAKAKLLISDEQIANYRAAILSEFSRDFLQRQAAMVDDFDRVYLKAKTLKKQGGKDGGFTLSLAEHFIALAQAPGKHWVDDSRYPAFVRDVFSGIAAIDMKYCLKPQLYWLQDAIARSKSVGEVRLGSRFSTEQTVNASLVRFVTQARHVKCFDASGGPMAIVRVGGYRQLEHLADAIRLAPSLEVLDVSYNRIGDVGVIFILEAMQKRAGSRIKQLKMNGCGLAASSIARIVKYWKKNESLQSVSVVAGCSHSRGAG